MKSYQTKQLDQKVDYPALDGSEIHLLLNGIYSGLAPAHYLPAPLPKPFATKPLKKSGTSSTVKAKSTAKKSNSLARSRSSMKKLRLCNLAPASPFPLAFISSSATPAKSRCNSSSPPCPAGPALLRR